MHTDCCVCVSVRVFFISCVIWMTLFGSAQLCPARRGNKSWCVSTIGSRLHRSKTHPKHFNSNCVVYLAQKKRNHWFLPSCLAALFSLLLISFYRQNRESIFLFGFLGSCARCSFMASIFLLCDSWQCVCSGHEAIEWSFCWKRIKRRENKNSR